MQGKRTICKKSGSSASRWGHLGVWGRRGDCRKRGPFAGGKNHMHGKGDHLQVRGSCMERETICRERGPFAGRGDRLLDRAIPAGGTGPIWGGTFCRGREPYAWKGEPSAG